MTYDESEVLKELLKRYKQGQVINKDEVLDALMILVKDAVTKFGE